MTNPEQQNPIKPTTPTIQSVGETCFQKVLHYYPDFGAMGGIERYIETVTVALKSSDNFKPVVVCSADTPFYTQLKEIGIVYGLRTLPVFVRPSLRLLDVFSMIQLLFIVKKEKPDLVHLHVGQTENLLFKTLGYPMVYTFHGYGSLYSLDNAKSFLKRFAKKQIRQLFKNFVPHLSTLLFVSQAEQKRLREEGYLPESVNGICMSNALSFESFQAESLKSGSQKLRQELNIPEAARVITFINRLDDNKNPMGFIDFAEQLSQRPESGPMRFLIVGDGPLSAAIEHRLAESPIANITMMLGYRSDVPAILAASDLVAHLPYNEGFGLGVLETMAAGTPCIASAVGGIMDTLDTPETRFMLIAPEDTQGQIQRTIEILSLSPEARQALSQAMQNRASDFDLKPFMNRLEGIYRNVLQPAQPKVSVILAVYQGEDFILRAVQSVLQQTYPHFELIVVDDGSTDSTMAKLVTIQDSRLTVITHTNQGVSKARNLGALHATGDYLAFIDADDMWFAHKLETEMATIARNQDPVCLVYSGYYAVDESDLLVNFSPVFQESGNLMETVLEREGVMLPSTTLLHRQIFDAIDGFPTDSYHEDRVFFILACQDFPAYATGERLIIYRQAMSGRCRSVLKDFDAALEAELSIVESLKPILSESRINRLKTLQTRNLMVRFLMYNFPASARALQQQVEPALLLQDKKGLLTLFSLKVGINALYASRLLVQFVTRYVFFPWWRLKSAPVYHAH
jgi:glycosyltransferase involved in cell wall biosynthesis